MDKEDIACKYNRILLSQKNEVMPFAAASIDLEGIILSEVSHKEKPNTI